MDAERDRAISEHVVRMHRYRAPGEQDGEGGCQILIVFNYLLLFFSFAYCLWFRRPNHYGYRWGAVGK